MSKEKESMKDVVENFITNLKKSGVKVSGAAILKLDDENVSDEAVDKAMTAAGMKTFPFLAPKTAEKKADQKVATLQPAQGDERSFFCPCSDCFNFETFEENLSKLPGNKNFYYKEFDVEGVIYDLKICKSEDRGVDFMIAEKEIKPSINPNWNEGQLNNALNEAVKNKDFANAQLFLNALNQYKK